MNFVLRATAVSMLAVSIIACAGRGADPDDVRPAPASGTALRVENHNWSDITVYAVRNGSRQRIGTVTTGGTERLRIPRTAVAGDDTVRLLLDPIGSRESHLTTPIQVSPGAEIDLRVENHLQLSSWSVR